MTRSIFRQAVEPVKLLVGVAILIAFASPLRADEPLIKGFSVGILAHDVNGLWSGFRREHGINLNAEIAFKSLYTYKTYLSLYPAAGLSLNNLGDTSKIYGGIRLEYRHMAGFFANIGIGGALHDGELETSRRDRKSLGSRILFHIPFEIGAEIADHHRISLYFDHVSNGYLADENDGLDTLGVRYGYRY